MRTQGGTRVQLISRHSPRAGDRRFWELLSFGSDYQLCVPVTPIYPRRWWALGALAVSLLTVGLDLTVLNVAVPTLAVDLGATTTQLQWFGTAYTLALAALLLPAGLLGDRFGPKKLLLGALALFGLASLGCAYADSPGQL